MERRLFFKAGLTVLGTMALADKALALKYYPAPSDKKCAILYSTWCGSSRDAAVWISEGMGGTADVFDLREQPDLKAYQQIIIGGSIRGMGTSKELQDYLKKNSDWLGAKVRGLFAVCGNMRNPVGPEHTAKFIDNHLARLCNASNVPSKVFLGRVTKSLMDPQTAKMMAGMDDYDNLKRPECLAFGRQIAASIAKEKAP